MSKRFFAFLLVLSLLFSLVACSDSKDDTASDPAKDTVENVPADDAQEGDTTPEPGNTVDGTASIGGAGEAAADHPYTEITVGSLSMAFVGHFDGTSGFSIGAGTAGLQLCFDHVFMIDPESTIYISEILSDYSFDEETNIATMTVKDGVKFNRNGEQMLAEDLLYSFECNALSPFMGATWSRYVDFTGAAISDNGMTLSLPFKVTFGCWMDLVSNPGIIDKSWIEEHGGDDFDYFDPALCNGSGSYVPTEFTIDISIVFERAENWWNADSVTTGYCYADKITCLQYSDETSMMVDFENGVIDLALSLSTTSMERVIANPDIGTAQAVPSGAVALLTLNYDEEYGTEVFENEYLRKAICYGTDTNALSELGYGVLYSPATSYIPAASEYCVPGYTYEYEIRNWRGRTWSRAALRMWS